MWGLITQMESVSHIFLLITLSYFVMLLGNDCFTSGWLLYVSKQLLDWRLMWGKVKLSLLGRWVTWMIKLVYFSAGWVVWQWNIWECLWVHRLRQLLFGIPFWIRWKRNFLVDSDSSYQGKVDSLCWKAICQAFQHAIFLRLPSLNLWLTDWKEFREISSRGC